MANRFPLIIDSATNRIVELPATDNLDLAGSNISSVANITAGNSVTASYFVGTLYGVANIAIVANSVAGANVSGEVGFAAVANSVAAANISGTITATTAGTVTTNAQPNITSTGSLTGLTVSNASGVVNFITTSNVSLGDVANLKITGGSANQYLQTDGTGNVTFATLNAASYQLQPVVAATPSSATAITLSGTQTIDGVAVTVGQRVLVKNQLTQSENGIYVCAAGAWSRASDFTTGAATFTGGVTVAVINGTDNAGTQWICTNSTSITAGSTAITFTRNNINRILAASSVTDTPAYVNQNPAVANSIAFGQGANSQVSQGTAIGAYANAGSYGTALGYQAKATNLGTIAIGILANATNGVRSIAIGENSITNGAISAGLGYGTFTNGANAVAIATNANANGVSSIAIGGDSKAAGNFSISIGAQAGGSTAGGQGTISIGEAAGYVSQGANSIAIGRNAGEQSQNAFSIALGYKAGVNNQGANAVAIGTNAGFLNQANNTIILNATGANLNQTTANTFTVKPVRNANTANVMFYNSSTGEITYDISSNIPTIFGSFTSNATQTSAGANTVNYMTLNNTEDANGVSIVSNSQITIARTGRYDIQFSAELGHDTNNTANVEIWLTKNGNAVANTNTIITLTKDEKAIAAWDWLVNANTANDYFQIAWASSDTNVEIIATDAANTIANVAAPSVIVTVIPVGA